MKKNKIKLKNREVIINTHDDHIGNVVQKTKNFYEFGMLDYINKNIPKNGYYIDVGANVGNHSLFFSLFCSDQVIAIEPIPENIKILKENIKDNKLTNLTVVDRGISIDGREMSGNLIKNNMGACYLSEGKGLKTISVTELCESIDISKITLIKIDVENMSLEVFKAFLPILQDNNNIHLFIEASKTELKEILELSGFKAIRQFNATPTYYLKK